MFVVPLPVISEPSSPLIRFKSPALDIPSLAINLFANEVKLDVLSMVIDF